MRFFSILLVSVGIFFTAGKKLAAVEMGAGNSSYSATDVTFSIEENQSAAHFKVLGFRVEGSPMISTNLVKSLLAKYTGPDITEDQLVKAASDLHYEYCKLGYPFMSVALARDGITNGIVTLNVFQTVIPQIVVSGQCYLRFGNTIPDISTNRWEIARLRSTEIQKPPTKPGSTFTVKRYLVVGNTILAPQILAEALTNADGAYGTNVTFEGVEGAVACIQQAYHDRGYVTVWARLPQQTISNATVKIEVVESQVKAIKVIGNRYFSDKNVLAAMPGLHTNMVLNEPEFQAELNRANANQDRQIYPLLSPGPDPGTTALMLRVKDQLPVHGMVELNNMNTPGTPDLRVNSSAVANNLWQLEQSLGIQYSFTPEGFKTGNQWDFYDTPLVATYSGYYRIPLGSPESLDDIVESEPGNFGYNEATRQFRLPPPSGLAELNLFASRSSIDTGIETLINQDLLDIPDVRQITRQEVQQGLTVNQDIGFLISKPLPQVNGFNSTVSGGLDFKTYQQQNFNTNIFIFNEFVRGPNGNLIERTSQDIIQTPISAQRVAYLPLALNFNGSMNNFMGAATLGLALSANLWYSSSTLYTSQYTNAPANLHGLNSLQSIAGSSESTGHWVVLRPSFSQDIMLFTNWPERIRADGQWSSEPLISNEQFGIGGENSVRGYHEGEVFGDTGWHVSLDQMTPTHTVGLVGGDTPLTLRGVVYMDLADAYLLDPHGAAGSTELWGTGFGFTAAVGSHWESRFLFSVPLISTAFTPRDQPYFNFGLKAQF